MIISLLLLAYYTCVLVAINVKTSRRKSETIDEYIAAFPPNIQKILEELRQTIRNSAPDAKEAISYQIPTFKLNGNLVHFAAFKNHIGFYPTSTGIAKFKKELSHYELSKGTVRFPINEPIPLDLVKKIVKFRVKENLEKRRQTKEN
jgi:uncharacterized protein YdhG (YjbR/CyaY superfamily)